MKQSLSPEARSILRYLATAALVAAAFYGGRYLLDTPAREERRERAQAMADADREMQDRGLVRMDGPPSRPAYDPAR